jgi:parvulin-like peptidyl-prolyl isomerase
MVPQLPRAEAQLSQRLARRAGRKAGLALLLTAVLGATAGADVNRIVLRVNNEIATLWEFEQRRRSRIQEIQRADLAPERRQRLLADVGAQTMREMYEELLVLSRAEQLDIRISDREVASAVEQTKSRFGMESDEEFRAALAESGMSLDDLGDQMRRNLLIREVMGREVQQKIQLEEEDLRRYYRDHPDEFSRPRRLEVREVVIPDEAAASDEARDALAAEVRSALLAGADGSERLAELADSGQATGVLELGWIARGDLEEALERGIWELEPGAVSQPIAARAGRHVIEVLAEEQARLLPFIDVQEEIGNKLRAGRYETEMANFLAELEDNSYVVQNLPPEAAGFRAAGDRDSRDELSGFGLVPEDAPQAELEEAPEDDSEAEAGASEPPE